MIMILIKGAGRQKVCDGLEAYRALDSAIWNVYVQVFLRKNNQKKWVCVGGVGSVTTRLSVAAIVIFLSFGFGLDF